MRAHILLATVALAGFLAVPAAAATEACPALLAKVEAALPSPPARLSPAQRDEAVRLRDEGRELCGRGLDRQALERLEEAELILGLR